MQPSAHCDNFLLLLTLLTCKFRLWLAVLLIAFAGQMKSGRVPGFKKYHQSEMSTDSMSSVVSLS